MALCCGSTVGIEPANDLFMSVYRFEDLRVWQAAKKQCDRVGQLIKRPDFQRDREMSGQMNDASISVMFNISEGFLRRRDKETMSFLRYSYASNGELKAGYYACEGRNYITSMELAELIELNESISKMLRRWQGTLDVDEGPRTKRGPRTKDGPGTKDGPRTKDGPGTKDGPRTKA
jgi:four helix bundle protein